MTSDYKTSKEAFVSGMTGSSIGHINMVSSVALSSVALYYAFRTRIPWSKTYQFTTEFSLLVVPLLCSVTLFANTPGVLSLCMSIAGGLSLLLPRLETGIPLPSSLHPSRASSPQCKRGTDPSQEYEATQNTPVAPLPALTTYRAHMLLLTFLCILAVDFPIFPRSLAKCETFGASLMDVGVGSFVFSSGIVSAIPLIKTPSYLSEPLIPKVIVVTRKCAPLMLLGVLRTLSVKGVEYPSEYGVHWNFFFTLAFVPILQVLLHPLMLRLPISLLGVLVSLFQQLILSAGLMGFVLTSPRVGLIGANKEGIVSLTGYLAIYLLGISTGTVVLPPSPSYFRRRQQQLTQVHSNAGRKAKYSSDSDSDESGVDRRGLPRRLPVPYMRENDKTAIELSSYAVVWWVLFAVAKAFGIGGGISRRVVNLQYIIWVSAYNTSFLLGYILLDLIFFPSPFSKSTYSPTSKLKVHPDPGLLDKRKNKPELTETPPALFEAVNRNGLVLFLLANFATGLINLSLPTMYMSDWLAMVVLSVYMLSICSVAWWCRNRRILKL
ncbi:GWT1-domain-containing protein [Sparassis latifolia]